MATITRTPEKVSLVGNDIVLGTNTTNHLSQVGQKAILVVDVTGLHSAGEYFQVIVNGEITDNTDEVVQFDCVNDTGGYTGNNLPYPSETSGTVETYAGVITEWMNKSALITKFFKIYQSTSDASQIIIESKINITGDVTLGPTTASIISASTQSGLKDIRKQNFYVVMRIDVFDELENQWSVASEKSYSPNDNGDVNIDISKVLRTYLLEMNFSFPESSSNLLIERPLHCRKYRVFVYEDDNGTLSDKIVTNNLYAMRGGLSFRQQAIYNMQGTSFWDKLNYDFSFLTYAEIEKQVSMHQPVKLYFLNYSEASTLNFKVKFYQESGSVTYTMESVGANQYKVYEVIVTPSKLADNITESFIKFDVWMADENDTKISELRTYILDEQFKENERWFLFENSLGAAQIMRTIGKRKKQNEYSHKLAQLKLDFDFTDKDREESTIERTEQQKFEAEIGFSENPQAIENYRDFLLSKKVFEVIGKQLIPVSIMSKTIEMPKDEKLPFSVKFSYQRAFTDNYYSKEKVPDKYGFDYTSDFDRPWNQ